MGRYLCLQGKRLAKFLPGAALAMLVLLGGLLGVFSLTVGQTEQAAGSHKFQVALVGTADDTFVQMGVAALRTFDSTQLSMEIVEMEEAEARAALEAGTIGAYIVIPEDFVDEAMAGRILPLRFVSTVGAASVVSVFKEEVTQVISVLLLQSQRGVYGMQAAMKDASIGGRGDKMNELAFQMVEYILIRDRTYRLEELGVSDSVGLEGYLLCGLWVLFLWLSCLPFAPLLIRRDLSLERMLASRGPSLAAQALWEFTVYFLSLLVLVLVTLALAGAFAPALWQSLSLGAAVPVALLAAAFSYMLYALCADLIGGVLLQFFTAVALCFVSGCMYPVYFFPESVQRLAPWLPTGAARDLLAGVLTGQGDERALWLVLGCSGAFCALGVAARVRRARA